ncbi:MAG: aminotransferase class V-fold PLP-dependent enzyme [Pseudomonadales bacterium]
MTNNNRRALLKTGLLGTAALAMNGQASIQANTESGGYSLDTWPAIRALFPLQKDVKHMAGFLLASHPTPVSDAIDRYRKQLDHNPAQFLMEQDHALELASLKAAASYIKDNAENIALIRSTTEGLATLYQGINIAKGQEVLTSSHDHYATYKSLEFSTAQNGASIKRIDLYDQENPQEVSEQQILKRIESSITSSTRVLALTWVHSSSGVKLPIAKISALVATANIGRSEQNRLLFCVDGVHGFGIENIDVRELGCDFFIAGTHKWMLGPRGTGILWGKAECWQHVSPTVPTFDLNAFLQWMKFLPESPIPGPIRMTPGGTHAYEHRWAMTEAFQLHEQIGKQRIQDRIHELNAILKKGLSKIKGVSLKTPQESALSSGITAFEIRGLSPRDSVSTMRKYNIIASQAPYSRSYLRLSPGLLNDESEVDYCIETVSKLVV